MPHRAVLFAWRRYPPPFLIGGAEVSQRLLAEEFASTGWQVTYLGSHEAPWDGASALVPMRRQLNTWGVPPTYDDIRGELSYQWNGIQCHSVPQSAVFSTLDTMLRSRPPELVVTSQEGSAVLAKHARQTTAVAGWIHSVSHTGTEVLRGGPHYALATSQFVLDQIGNWPGTRIILFYPPFAPPSASPNPAGDRPDDLLMVNPVPAKGAALVKALAHQLPHRRFTLVEGWWDTHAHFARLTNVRYLRRTYEMDRLYATHRLLLVPSVVEDAFPRVIIEAGLARVPTIGSDRGGIAEAIDDGGLVIPNSDVTTWISAIEKLNGSTWADRSRHAHARSTRLVRSCLAELAAAGAIAST